MLRRPRAFALLTLVAFVIGCGGRDEAPDFVLPDVTPFEEDLALHLTAIATEASKVRELDWQEDLQQGTLSQDQLAEFYEQAATDAALQEEVNFNALNTMYRLLHMIGPDDDILDLSGAPAAADILGFYAHDSDQLVLISDSPGELSLDDEATLAHEYVHSFQDKRFDLQKMLKRVDKETREKANTEYGDALDALIEGDATVAEFQYIEKKVGAEGLRQWIDSSGGEEAGDTPEEAEIPPAFGRYGAFPYAYGSLFVRHLYDEGGWQAVDQAYEEPPKTEEQILHPEKYLDGEEPAALKLRDLSNDLGKGWQQESDTMFGEFDVYNWIRSTLDSELQATSAAAGWGGGRMAVYSNTEDESQVLVQLALIWDSKDEAREFYTTFGDVVRRIDAQPTILDPSLQIVGWDAEDEVAQAWIERTSFNMIVAVNQEDLDIAKRVIEAPASIPQSGYVLQGGQSPAVAAAPVRQLEDTLLHAGDLPPGFVLVESGNAASQAPLLFGNFEQRYSTHVDVRSGQRGVTAVVARLPGAPGFGLDEVLTEEALRNVFDGFAFGAGGEVRDYATTPADGVGEAAIAARADIVGSDGTVQSVQVIMLLRSGNLGVLITFEGAGSERLDAAGLARIIDDRLGRHQP